jgi:hypothetical protein
MCAFERTVEQGCAGRWPERCRCGGEDLCGGGDPNGGDDGQGHRAGEPSVAAAEAVAAWPLKKRCAALGMDPCDIG